MPELTQEYLMSILQYNPKTGIFVWVRSSSNRVSIGDVAGKTTVWGYRRIGIGGKTYSAHRLAWLYMTGRHPEGDLDHINRIRDDNKWENLRECTRSENCANAPLAKNNTSGFKGVTRSSRTKKWNSCIGFRGGSVYLGTYVSPEEAARAYNSKAVELFGEFASLNNV